MAKGWRCNMLSHLVGGVAATAYRLEADQVMDLSTPVQVQILRRVLRVVNHTFNIGVVNTTALRTKCFR